MSEHLHHKLATLHQNLLHGKLPRSIQWSDVAELIGHLGEVQPQGGDEFAFIIGTQREIFKRPHDSELGIDEASRLRRFLKEAQSESEARSEAPTAKLVRPCRVVVVIDHRAAHIFRDLSGEAPKAETTIKPYDPYHFHRHLIHRKEAHYQGDRVPEETSFYEDVAEALVSANDIVLIGHGTGKSRAVDVLVEFLKKHHPEVAQRVTAVETADLSALTDPEVEAIAKKHMPVQHLAGR